MKVGRHRGMMANEHTTTKSKLELPLFTGFNTIQQDVFFQRSTAQAGRQKKL